MICWYRGTQIERMQLVQLDMRDYLDSIKDLQNDETIPMLANNIVYLAKDDDFETIDRDILYSVLDRDPKRAEAYWFISVNSTDRPYQAEYEVETFGTDYVYRINLNLGYKVKQRINLFLRQIVQDLKASGELPPQTKRHSIYGPSDVGSFKFCMIRKMLPLEGDMAPLDSILIRTKYAIRRIAGSPDRWFGLQTSNVIIEYVPMFLPRREHAETLERIKHNN